MSGEKRNYIWWVAIVCMVCDHLGAWVIQGDGGFWLRVIGRVGLPTWGYAIACGYHSTRDLRGYVVRVLVVAVISVPPYWMLTGSPINPVFALAVGLLALWANEGRRYVAFGLAVMMMAVVDMYMAMMPVVFGWQMGLRGHQTEDQEHISVCSVAIVTVLYAWSTEQPWQLVGLLGLLVIYGPGEIRYRPGRELKYFFYPVHLVLLGLVRSVIW